MAHPSVTEPTPDSQSEHDFLLSAYTQLRRTLQTLPDSSPRITPTPQTLTTTLTHLPSPTSPTYLHPWGPSATLAHLLHTILPSLNHQSLSPLYFAFVTGSVLPIAEAADNLVSALDQNVQVHFPLPPTTTPPSSSPPKKEPHYLLAQISQNMTLTKPTLILTDTTKTPFALVFASRPATGPDTLDFSALGYRVGHTLVVPQAKRVPPKQPPPQEEQDQDSGNDRVITNIGSGGSDKKGFVAVERGEEGGVRVIAVGLEGVVRVGRWLRERDSLLLGLGKGCEGCGKEKEGGGLRKCTGCGEVGYCCKVSCFVGWSCWRLFWVGTGVADVGVL